MWQCRWFLFVKVLPHSLHLNRWESFECLSLTCLLTPSAEKKVESHLGHGKLILR